MPRLWQIELFRFIESGMAALYGVDQPAQRTARSWLAITPRLAASQSAINNSLKIRRLTISTSECQVGTVTIQSSVSTPLSTCQTRDITFNITRRFRVIGCWRVTGAVHLVCENAGLPRRWPNSLRRSSCLKISSPIRPTSLRQAR